MSSALRPDAPGFRGSPGNRRPTAGLPLGFGVAIDPDTTIVDERTLLGGVPARVVRLSDPGATAWRGLQHGRIDAADAATLARRLTDAGLVHPRPSTAGARRRLTAAVVIPVRDRVTLLDQCLAGIGHKHPVVVVDDNSADPSAVAEVTNRHAAILVRRAHCGGPAAARNAGLEHTDTELVAFVDSDCVPPPEWLERLVGHFDDPLVGAVAPRIVAAGAESPAGRYGALFGSLDLGAREGRVGPEARIRYVPSAALVIRRAALRDVARDGAVFDPGLRYGEDVDLIWRLHQAGWRIRYDPSVEVTHREPLTWRGVLGRRFRYGTSAAPLAAGHPGALAPLVLRPWPSAVVAAVLGRRPVLAAACLTAASVDVRRSLRSVGLPATSALPGAAAAARQTWLASGRYLCQFASPALLTGLMLPGRRRWSRRAAIMSLLLTPALSPAAPPAAGQPPYRLAPPHRALARLVDDMCYGAGVYTGCLRTRTLVPLVPRVRWRRRDASVPAAERVPP